MPKETAKREREMDEDNAGKAEEVEEGDKRETKTRVFRAGNTEEA